MWTRNRRTSIFPFIFCYKNAGFHSDWQFSGGGRSVTRKAGYVACLVMGKCCFLLEVYTCSMITSWEWLQSINIAQDKYFQYQEPSTDHFLQPSQPFQCFSSLWQTSKFVWRHKDVFCTVRITPLPLWSRMKCKAKITNLIQTGSKRGWFWVKSNGRVQWKHKIVNHKRMCFTQRIVPHSNKSSRSMRKASVAKKGGENEITSRRILKTWGIWGTRKLPISRKKM